MRYALRLEFQGGLSHAVVKFPLIILHDFLGDVRHSLTALCDIGKIVLVLYMSLEGS